MAALQVHFLDELSYRQSLVSLLKPLENPSLAKVSDPANSTARGLQPHYDGGHNLALGYGFDLFVQSFGEIQQRLAQVGVTFANPAAVQTALQQAKQQAKQIIAQFGVNTAITQSNMGALGLQLGSVLRLPNVVTAENLLKLAIEVREPLLDTLLASRGIPKDPTTGLAIPFSKEREALVSLYYNNGSTNFTADLTNALKSGNRAEAWFQIRYNSNKGVDVADRRYREADLFGLYDGQNQPLNDSDAINAIRTLREPSHFALVEQYEASHRLVGTAGFREQLVPAYQRLITNFGLGRPIEEALVAITALGGDPIQGGERNDLLLGDISHDILIGGGGDDLLRGEGGKDVYVYNSGDGEDTIFDTDGQGLVIFDHHLLAGGIKKQSESVYKSPDGQFTYQRSGSDLVVNGTLTIKD